MENRMNFADITQKFCGYMNDMALFLEREQLLDRVLWGRFVNQFREQIDGSNKGWRGEYWGKMLRGGVLVYEYTGNEELYEVLTETVRDMLTVAESSGRVSSYSAETEFSGWDLWCRKYVLLGLIYYYDICKDAALKADIVDFLCRSADYIIARVGNEEGKKNIASTSNFWFGVNSSSILEPMVRLYRLTGEKRFFAFAEYIIEEGGAKGINIFELAYQNKLYPYQYGVSKAYEMISCFEGLIEYYCVTGIEKYKIAAVNFAKAIMDSDITVIGTCGCTHELFDHSKTRQTAFYDGIMQETCVTVTWMKFCARLLRLTGETLFADYMEKAFYNAYAGAFNREHKTCDFVHKKYILSGKEMMLADTFLPFDSYSPLTSGKRGQVVGGCQLLPDKSYYGCCVAIGAAGVGVFAKHAVLTDADGIVVNFYEKGEQILRYKGQEIRLVTETEYPVFGKIIIQVETTEELDFALKIRVPSWSENTTVETGMDCVMEGDYAVVRGTWVGKQVVEVTFGMEVRAVYPIPWDEDVIYTDLSNLKDGQYVASAITVTHMPEDDAFVAFTYGPLVLGVDSRMGKGAGEVFRFKQENGSYRYRLSEEKEIVPGTECQLHLEFEGAEGETIHLVDYASAGQDWKTDIAAWMKTRQVTEKI